MVRPGRCRRSAPSGDRRDHRSRYRGQGSQAARLRYRYRERRRCVPVKCRAPAKSSRWPPVPLPRRRSNRPRCSQNPLRPGRLRRKPLRPLPSRPSPRHKSSQPRKCRRYRDWSRNVISTPVVLAKSGDPSAVSSRLNPTSSARRQPGSDRRPLWGETPATGDPPPIPPWSRSCAWPGIARGRD